MLREKALQEYDQPFLQRGGLVFAVEREAGHPQQLGRPEAEPYEIIEVEIMQLVGTDQLFGTLRDPAVSGGRQQFGTDRGVGDVEQAAAG